MNKESLMNFYNSHRGGINGALAGLIIAIFILVIGFWRTLFIVICISVGYYLGEKLTTEKDYIKNLLDKILPPGTYR